MPAQKMTYRRAGVNVGLGDLCSRIAYKACTKTFANRKGKIGEAVPMDGGFSGPSYVKEMRNAYLVQNSDGVGSKALVAQYLDKHDTLGFDLVAMVADDAVSMGAEPVSMTNSLDIKRVHPGIVRQLMKGLVEAAQVAEVAVVGGEIAELRDQVAGHGEHPYIWNADLTGVLEQKKLVDGRKIRPGDAIVGLQSNGIRSNGLTLARKTLEQHYGKEWFEERFRGRKWAQVLLTPSQICTQAILELGGAYGKQGKARVHGLMHVTGGGIPGKMKRVLKRSKYGAHFFDPFSPNPEFLALQEIGRVSDEEAYHAWNMGQCFAIVTPEPGKILGLVQQHGFRAHMIGKITEKREIRIDSKGREGKRLIVPLR